jgi:MHS family proline/betaine transporter-like MFS transporter
MQYKNLSKKQVLIASLGNTLEWFDFGLFIFLAPIIGVNFFPSDDPITSTLATLSIFAAGFICRPLGGIIFGHSGDTHGRAKTLRISILIITLSTLCIGLLPTYKSIGILAPVLFGILRLSQGFSVGGEYSGVMIYLAESAPNEKRGFITSFAGIGANIGFLTATLVVMLLNYGLSHQEVVNWGWRIPFLLIGIPGSLLLYFRFKLAETPTFTHLKQSHHLEKSPFITVVRHAPKQLLKILGITFMSSSLYYVFFGYMPHYLHDYFNIANSTAFLLQSFFLITMLFLAPLAAICGDRFGRKNMMMLTAFGTIIFAIPGFYLLQFQSIPAIFLSLAIATLLSSSDQGNSLSAVVENCPANVRYSGIAFSYNLGTAIVGGTAPLVVTLLTQKIHVMAPAFYLILMAAITLIAASTLLGKGECNRYIE